VGQTPAVTDYERRTTHSRNRLVRFSHRARMRAALAYIDRYLPDDSAMLDFGCAQGQLLQQVAARHPRAQLFGLDPFSSPGEGYVHLRSFEECRGKRFGLIGAFEVLEHLNDAAAEDFFRLVHDQLSDEGVCIVSVPNMLGPALAPKLLHNRLTSGIAWNYTAREAWRALLNLQSPTRLPPSKNGTMRHKGYDWRATRARIASEFDIVAERFTPLPFLWWGFNSQWFCVFRPRAAMARIASNS
jgi:2-polyprenyl-3-methyl-5-hydroxy-6-metoxy-1,4-benzoquinol methylase